MKKTLFFCIFYLSYSIVYAQQQKQKLDSLQKIYTQHKQDSNYYKAIASISEIYRGTNPDSSLKYANLILSSNNKNILPKSIASVYNSIGYANYYMGNYTQAIQAFQNYYSTAKKANDKTNMAFAINNEGNVYIELGNYTKALEKYNEALQIRKENNDDFGIAASYSNIGFVYKDIGDYEKALSNFYFALNQYQKINAEQAIGINYNYIGSVYWRKKDYAASIESHEKALAIQKKYNDKNGIGISLQSIGNIYGEQKQYDKATQYFNDAITNYSLINDIRQISLVKSNIAEIAYRKGDYTKALDAFKESITLSKKINNKRNLPTVYLGAAATEIKLNNLPSAKNYLDSSENILKETPKKEDRKNFYQISSDYFAANNDYKTALNFFNKYSNEKDSILNENNLKAIADMQVKYETEKKQMQIELLGKENSIQNLAIQNQKLELNKRLYELTQKKLQLSNAQLLIAANQLEIANKNEKILQQQFDSSQKEQNILLLTKQSKIKDLEISNQKLAVTKKNILLIVTTAISALLMLLGYSYYRRYKLKKEQQLQAEVFKQQELATKAVLVAEENERKRIAGDLHDGIGQMMSAAKMNLSAMENEIPFATEEQRNVYKKALNLVDESCKEVRSVSHNMMPNALLKSGLASAVRDFLQQIDSRVIKIDLYTEGLTQNIDTNIETVLYRVIQECVNNVIKHANANHLDLSLIKDEDGIAVTIEDNGKGFDVNNKSNFNGIGLKNISTRIQYLKGTVEWNSSPNNGTLVAIHIPC